MAYEWHEMLMLSPYSKSSATDMQLQCELSSSTALSELGMAKA